MVMSSVKRLAHPFSDKCVVAKIYLRGVTHYIEWFLKQGCQMTVNAKPANTQNFLWCYVGAGILIIKGGE